VRPSVGDRVLVTPAHVDPTMALHERIHLVRGGEVVDTLAIDLRSW
jgi:D-serine deaminase-like pyridoxal phosphate-dependent protein